MVRDGDPIVIDIPNRVMKLDISDEELAARRAEMDASERPWQPENRVRPISTALKTYALLATSADKGAVRDTSKLPD